MYSEVVLTAMALRQACRLATISFTHWVERADIFAVMRRNQNNECAMHSKCAK